jgi:hypothetical protein
MKDFNQALCDFFAHPGAVKGSASQFAKRALDLMLSCEVRLLIIDDLHFLHWQPRGGPQISNQFKYIANEFPLTLLSIGIGLKESAMCSVKATSTRRPSLIMARLGPRHVSLEAKGCRHVAVAVPKLCVSRGIVASPRQ